MRIWSVHPAYLDVKGLSALWREALLAKRVLEGKTKGYKNHPQLIRFKKADNPEGCINCYLAAVYEEALNRGYNFDKRKISWDFSSVNLPVSIGQINYERTWLLEKLKARDKKKYSYLLSEKKILPHPLFEITEGDIEEWERYTDVPG